MNDKGYVYLLCDWSKDNAYKIGVTKGLIENRIKKLQTGSSGEIIMVCYYQTKYPFFIEKILHKRYSHKKILNEWFILNDKEVFEFQKTCKEIEDMIELMKDNQFFPKNLK